LIALNPLITGKNKGILFHIGWIIPLYNSREDWLGLKYEYIATCL
jgi:hypothetical protein